MLMLFRCGERTGFGRDKKIGELGTPKEGKVEIKSSFIRVATPNSPPPPSPFSENNERFKKKKKKTRLDFLVQTLESPSLREELGIPSSMEGGVRIRRMSPLGEFFFFFFFFFDVKKKTKDESKKT